MNTINPTFSTQLAASQQFIRQLSVILLVLYCLFVAYCALVPFDHWARPKHDILQVLMVGWINKIYLFDFIQNLLLYLPLGFFAVFAVSTTKRSLFMSLMAAFFISLFMSTLLEFLQSYNPARVPSALDILLNTLSGLIGALLALIFYGSWLRAFHHFGYKMMFPITLKNPLPLIGWMMIFVWWGYQWYPFLPTLHPTHIQQGYAPFMAVFHDWHLLDIDKIVTYFSQVFIVYCCTLITLRKWHMSFVFILLCMILPFKILMIGRVLSLEAVIGSFLGLSIAALLHQLLIKSCSLLRNQSTSS